MGWTENVMVSLGMTRWITVMSCGGNARSWLATRARQLPAQKHGADRISGNTETPKVCGRMPYLILVVLCRGNYQIVAHFLIVGLIRARCWARSAGREILSDIRGWCSSLCLSRRRIVLIGI